MNTKETEILHILMEEAAEVIQAVTKGNRFGYDFIKPGTNKTNREHLAEELGDLLAMITLCHDFGIVDFQEVMEAKDAKFEKLQKWSTIYEKTESI